MSEEQKHVCIDDLSNDAVFALTMIQAHHPHLTSPQRLQDFHRVFVAVFGVHFDEAMKSQWKPMYERGKTELADKGLLELERSGEGEWIAKTLREDLILPSKKARH